jgi:hypothetical protein
MLVFGGWNRYFIEYYDDAPVLYWTAPADVAPGMPQGGDGSARRDDLLSIVPNPFNPQAGGHEVRWDGRDAEGHAAGSGVYFRRLEAEDRILDRTLVLMK